MWVKSCGVVCFHRLYFLGQCGAWNVFSWIITPPWCRVKLCEASWTLSMIKWIENTHAGSWVCQSHQRCCCAAAVKTHGEVSQEDWPIEHSAAWRWMVPRRAGTDGTLKVGGGFGSSGGHLAGWDRWSLSFRGGGGRRIIVPKWISSTAHRSDHAVSELEAKKKKNIRITIIPSLSGGSKM